MAVKNDIDITIGGKTITLSGVESEDYLREVAAYLNDKLRHFTDDAAYWRLPNDMRSVMLQLNLADDYFKEHSRVLALEGQVQELEEHRNQSLRKLEEMEGAAQAAASRISALETDAAGLRDEAQRAAAAETSAAKRFGAEKSRAEKLAEEMDALRRSKAEADKAVERFKKELADTRGSLQGELSRTKADLEQRLAALEAQRNKEVQELQALREKEVSDLQAQKTKAVQDIQSQREREVQALREQHAQEARQKDETSAKALKEREDALQRELTRTKETLTKQLEDARAESGERGAALEKAEAENKKLRSQLDIALLNGERLQEKLAGLEKTFDDRLAADTEAFRRKAEDAAGRLEETQEELALLQEQETERRQAAARVRGTMQEIVQQYGRFSKSLEEAADQMRTLEE